MLATFEVTNDNGREGYEQLTAALDAGLPAHTHTTADINADTTAAGGIVIRQLATHPGFRASARGVHNPGPADTGSRPEGAAVAVTPDAELRRAHAAYTHARAHFRGLTEEAETGGNTDAADHYADTTLATHRDAYIDALERMLHHLGIDPAALDPAFDGELAWVDSDEPGAVVATSTRRVLPGAARAYYEVQRVPDSTSPLFQVLDNKRPHHPMSLGARTSPATARSYAQYCERHGYPGER